MIIFIILFFYLNIGFGGLNGFLVSLSNPIANLLYINIERIVRY